eukprot:6508888-Pyramimonas_sp.AAC.1
MRLHATCASCALPPRPLPTAGEDGRAARGSRASSPQQGQTHRARGGGAGGQMEACRPSRTLAA